MATSLTSRGLGAWRWNKKSSDPVCHSRNPRRPNRHERTNQKKKKTTKKKILYPPHQVISGSNMKTAVVLAVVCVVAMMQLSARGASADVPFRNLEERAGSLANFFRSGNQPALRFGRGGVGNMPAFRFGRRSYDGIGDDDNLE
ncbi:Hypp517 [Branchiostoma lanceolatum]|uniref:Hypp517 protein n=1 Tax=Branchiostoma lanceolatum TaxID=7740 RepID=A0A8J9WDP9_BRALA|nr:Hypp517 [Branchiostoma lanceolatum]